MCNCIEKLNEALRSEQYAYLNTQIDVPLVVNLETGQIKPPQVRIAVVKLNDKVKRKPAPYFPTYCPFCREKY